MKMSDTNESQDAKDLKQKKYDDAMAFMKDQWSRPITETPCSRSALLTGQYL